MSADRDAVPTHVERESTQTWRDNIGSAVGRLEGQLKEYKEHTPTFDQLSAQLTGLRQSLTAMIVAHATKEELRQALAQLDKDVAAIKPPSFWKLLGPIFGLFMVLAGLIWNVSSQSALIQYQLGEMRERLERIESTQKVHP